MKTLDNSTIAAIPGELAVSRQRYARYFSRSVGGKCYRLFCTCLPWIGRRLPWLGDSVFHWTQTKEHLRHGCLNPAVVLDSTQGLIAVFTSLTAVGDKPTPVVKILRERLDLIDPSRVKNGGRFAAASIYSRTQASWAQGRWSDFWPIVIDCLVDDRTSCKDAVARIKPLAWKALELALQKMDNRRKEGLFYVDVPDEIVWSAY
jgi:hypothetical protein